MSKINWNAYKESFKIKSLKLCFVLLAAIILFKKLVEEIWDALLVNPILSKVTNNSNYADLVIALLLIVSIAFLYKKISNYFLPTIDSIIFSVTILLIYFLFFKNDVHYSFYSFKSLPFISYATPFLIATLLFTSRYKVYFKQLKKPVTKKSFVEDNPDTIGIDSYGRGGYAKSIADHINASSTEKSFTIGILGEWGSGKTNFMLRTKEELIKNKEENIIIDFNPWRVNKPDAIINEFFKILSNKLRKSNKALEKMIKEYSKEILQTGKGISSGLADIIVSEFISEEDLETNYEEINASIKLIAKRIIVFIDDVDRLTGKEIMEVLRIIRNSANFANTFFVVGIDQSYIVAALEGTREFSNETQYLKKIFQLTIVLPEYKKSVLNEQLKQFLITDDLDNEEKSKMIAVISNVTKDENNDIAKYNRAFLHENVFEKLVGNIRDLKRFVNSFKIAFHILKDEVDLQDLFVLELIRNNQFDVYTKLKDKSFLTVKANERNKFDLKDKEIDAFLEASGNKISQTEAKKIKEALDYLIKEETNKTDRRFNISHNYWLYFSYQLFNLISLKKFRETIEKEEGTIIDQFKKWAKGNESDELNRILEKFDDYKDAQFLRKMCTVFFKTEHEFGYGSYYYNKKLIFHNREKNYDRYFNRNLDTYRSFLYSLFRNQTSELLQRAEVAANFLQKWVRSANECREYDLSKEEWQDLTYNLFNAYLQETHYIEEALRFLRLNEDSKTADDYIEFTNRALFRFKEYLLSNENAFEEFVRVSIISRMQPNDGTLLFNPFLEPVFKNKEEFKNKLLKTRFNDSSYNHFVKIVLEYIDEFFVNRIDNYFTIRNEADRNFIGSWLENNQAILNQRFNKNKA